MLENIIKDFYLNENHVKFYIQNLANGNKTIILRLNTKVVLIASETLTGMSILEKKKNWLNAVRIAKDCLKDEKTHSMDICVDKGMSYEIFAEREETIKFNELIDILDRLEIEILNKLEIQY